MANGVNEAVLGKLPQVASKLSSGPLRIIALFLVVWTLAIWFGQGYDASMQKFFVWLLVGFPVLLGVFVWLVRCHSEKIWGPRDFKDEENFVRIFRGKLDTSLSKLERADPDGKVLRKKVSKAAERALGDALEAMKPVKLKTLGPHARPDSTSSQDR